MDELLDNDPWKIFYQYSWGVGRDMWVLISFWEQWRPCAQNHCRELGWPHAEQPCCLFFDGGVGKETEYLAVARYDVGKVFKKVGTRSPTRSMGSTGQVDRRRNPKKIGINKAPYYGHADGLTANDYDKLIAVLPKSLGFNVTSAEKLAVAAGDAHGKRWPSILGMPHRPWNHCRRFSDRVIQPGVTTTDDVVWWYREHNKELKLDTWFHPSVSIQRAGNSDSNVIIPGDLFARWFRHNVPRLNIQTHAATPYVLKADERQTPEYLINVFNRGNRLQDILTGNFKTGKTNWNQFFGWHAQTDRRQRYNTQHLHASWVIMGTAAALPVACGICNKACPSRAIMPCTLNTAYSIELYAEWRRTNGVKKIRIQLEEDGYFDATGFRYIDGRQTEIILIPKPQR